MAIKQLSSANGGTTTTASLTIGGRSSGTWSVTTVDPCDGSPSIGTVCGDGSVYAGLSPDGNVPMYAMRCDIGMSWNGSSCAGSAATKTWNNGSTNWASAGVPSATTGESNSVTLVGLGFSSPAPYQAAQACTGTANGHNDWYLPAKDELNVLSSNQGSIGGFGSTYYWSSSEDGIGNAWRQYISLGSAGASKNQSYRVRCVRK